MLTKIKSAILLLVVILYSLPAAGQTEESTLATLEKNLPAVKTFEHGQNANPLMEIEQAVFALPVHSTIREAVEEQLLEALKSAETATAKTFLCTQLRVVGTEKCIPALEQIVTDPEVSSAAIYALGRLESVQASEALLRALGNSQGVTQAGIINAIADRRYQVAQPAILKLMQTTDSETVQRASARALGRLGGDDAVEQLLAVCRDAQGDVLLEAQNALLEAADTTLANGNSKQAANTYTAVLQLQAAPQFHVAALRGLVRALPDQAASLLAAEIAKSESPLVRDAIAMTTSAPGPAATKTFAALLSKLDSPNKILMLRALGERGDNSASATLVEAAGEQDQAIRLAALEALGGAGNTDAVAVLLQAASEQGAPSLVARRSLLLIPGTAVDQQLVQLLPTGGDAQRAEAARAVAGRGFTEAVPQLLTLARAQNDDARREAIKALGVLATQNDLPPLIALAVASKQKADQAVLIEAITRALGRTAADDRATPVLTALRTAPDAAKPVLLLILGKTGSPQALDAIRDGLTNRSADLQDAAVRALADWPEASASADLLNVLSSNRNQAQKELALQGYIRLANLSEDPTTLFGKVLQQVERVVDKKMVLAGLGLNAESPAAIELALPYLSDPELGPTAGLATLRIAHRLRDSHTKIARAALDQVLEKVDHEDVRQRAQEVVNEMDKFADHILEWVSVGPFTVEGKDGPVVYTTVFEPENPTATNVDWKPLTQGIGAWDINLEAEYGGLNHCAAYLRSRVWSPGAQKAMLEMGSDDAVKAWLNNQLVFDKWTQQGSAPRQHRVEVDLKEGWNSLLLKAVDFEGGWVVACRLRAADGTAIKGLKISAE